jgi:hypothetical protein
MAIFKLKAIWDKLRKEREEWRLIFGLTTMFEGILRDDIPAPKGSPDR